MAFFITNHNKKCQASKKRFAFLRVFVLCITILLSACSTELYQGLTEKQANEILAVLLNYGISAQKVSEGKNGFTISISEKDLTRSLEILKVNNLPGEAYTNLGDVFSGDSMISSASEDSARMAYAISQELSNTISQMDGVLTARVHVVLGSIDASTEKEIKASTAIFIRHNPSSPVVNYMTQLRDMTAKAVPDLSEENISITLMPVRTDVIVPLAPAPSFFTALVTTIQNSTFTFFMLLVISIGVLAFLALLAKDIIAKLRNAKKIKEIDIQK